LCDPSRSGNEMPSIIDSYSESNQDNEGNVGGIFPALGQCFTGSGAAIGSAQWYIKQYITGGATGNAIAKIYNTTGTYGTNAKPSGAALASSSLLDISTLTTSYALYTFNFTGANSITLTNGTRYCLTIENYDTWGGSERVTLGRDGSSPSHSGNDCYLYSGTWNAPFAGDFCFYVYSSDSGGASAVPVIMNQYRQRKA